MTPSDYEYLRKLLKERSGLDLSADKQYLVESRLVPLARRVGLTDIPELVRKIKGGGADALTTEVVEAMTTNETFFFRDKIPFDHMRETVLPAFDAGAGRPPRPAHLVGGLLDRAGALLDRDAPERGGQGAGGLANRNRRDRPVAKRA